MARGLDALQAGDGPTFLAVLQAPGVDRVRLFNALGAAADNSRWDVRGGRCVLHAADFLLEQPVEHIARFLPILAIAAAREHQYTNATKRDRAAELLARLRPIVALNEGAADMVARSGCHAWGNGERKESKDLLEVVRGCKLVANNAYYKQLVKHHAKKRR
jgi:hypothetical protein